jgi:hypothetical protein
MATVQYFDALGATQALDLVGESGMLPLAALGGSYPNASCQFELIDLRSAVGTVKKDFLHLSGRNH